MKCNNCGMENSEDTMFCGKCGERLQGKPSGLEGFNEDSKKEHLGENAQAPKKDESTSSKSNSNTSASNTINNKIPASPLARAWKDMHTSKNWFGKTLVLGLINCVPIFNFNVLGYAMNWGKKAGKDDGQMQKGYFEDHGFRNGFYGLVVALVYSIVLTIALRVVGNLFEDFLLIGSLISLALLAFAVVFHSYTALSCMRGCKDGNISKSFSLKEIFTAYKKKPGQVFTSWFVPQIIIAAIVFAIVIITACAFLGAYIPYISRIAQSASQLGTYSVIMALVKILGPALAIIAIIGIIGSILEAFATILNYRALGYWIADNAPEWNKD